MRLAKRTRTDPVAVSSVGYSHAQDLHKRQRRYLIAMSIRTLCFLGAVMVSFLVGWTWVTGLLVVGAVVLPYIAVVMANARDRRGIQANVAPVADRTPQRRDT